MFTKDYARTIGKLEEYIVFNNFIIFVILRNVAFLMNTEYEKYFGLYYHRSEQSPIIVQTCVWFDLHSC